MMRTLQVSDAGFVDVNGVYNEIEANVFQMDRNNGRIYSISIDDKCPFAFNVWSIKRVDGAQEVVIYCNTAKELENGEWKAVVGSEPWPIIHFVNDEMTETAAEIDCEKRKKWKKGNDILFWSRTYRQWTNGKIMQIQSGFLSVRQVIERGNEDDDEKKENMGERAKTESLWFKQSSALLQCAADKGFFERKLKKKDVVNVWSRSLLKWQRAIITDIERDYCFVSCGNDSRWIQRNSFLIQSVAKTSIASH